MGVRANSARVIEARARRGGATSAGESAGPSGEFHHAERQHLRQSLVSLTPREQDVVEAVWAGGSNETVAERMCVAIPTLRTHLMRIHRKLGTRGKGDLIRFVAERVLEGYRAGALDGKADASGEAQADGALRGKSSVSMTTAAVESSQ